MLIARDGEPSLHGHRVYPDAPTRRPTSHLGLVLGLDNLSYGTEYMRWVLTNAEPA